ncbi:hypothetical protein FIM12_08390 [SAR202 cluster bacterium AD-804-J14_MRT_500m]|nr:hypothetical protein [SAR202 cluster bacterium AD-804-J14_MRT_500m]
MKPQWGRLLRCWLANIISLHFAHSFRKHIPERDGILSSLLFLEFMARTGQKPSELLHHLFDLVGEHHFDRRDIAFDAQNRCQIEECLNKHLSTKQISGIGVSAVDSLEGIRFHCDESWVAIRFSGTEPLVRIYAESEDPDRVSALLDGAQELLGI